MEQWALFTENSSMCVERVVSIGKKYLTWGSHPSEPSRKGRVNLVLVLGLFPTYEAADDAKLAARYAIQRAQEAGEPALIWGKQAIKTSPGYMAVAQ